MVHLFHSDFPQGLLMSVELLHRSWKEKCRCITLIKDVLIARSSFISCYLKWSYFCLKIYWSKGKSPDVNQQWWYNFRVHISNIINIQTIYNAFNQYNQKYLSGHPLWLTFWRWWPLLVQVKAQGNNECVLIFLKWLRFYMVETWNYVTERFWPQVYVFHIRLCQKSWEVSVIIWEHKI